jgi:endogenous inhibitor of DNA gyrase (YacG/DUF329 family)
MDKTSKCPICSKFAEYHYTPFCSKRCADVDLGNWLVGSYAIPVFDLDPNEDEEGDEI